MHTAPATFSLVVMTLLAASSLSHAQSAAPSAGGSILDGVFTAAQASQGRRAFQLRCSSCHTVADHTGGKFATRWQGLTMADVFDLVSTTMPQTDPGSLEPEEYASVLAFFLNESGYKEGEQELPAEIDELKKIRVEPLAK